jgi:S-formylglutathione hydrolase FrmB
MEKVGGTPVRDRVAGWSQVSVLVSIGLCVSAVAAVVWLLSRAMFARLSLVVQIVVIIGCAVMAAVLTAIITADQAEPVRQFVSRISLMHGWVPVSVQAITAVVLVCAVGWRSRRWRMVWLPVALVFGVVLALWARWYIASAAVAGDPAPQTMWIWIALTGLAAGIMVVGWRGARWWRRGVSVLAVPLCLLSSALVLNLWVGYFPTVHTAWNQLTAGPLPDQTDRATVTAMQLNGVIPAKGAVVPVSIPADASKFKHRGELVYLPPAWFISNPPPPLPVVMMIGAEFNTPTDWLRAGNAVNTADNFASAHGGRAPVLVFVDSGGAFNSDTECVNGPRGNSADHLTKDVVPFMISNFGVSADRANWGVAGFSAGGTCAVDLTVTHPEMFTAFVDIAGDLRPNSGTKAQTITRLFGGNTDAWAAFDPTTVITRHGPYRAVSGWFTIAGAPGNPAGNDPAATTLCALGSANGIACAVVAQAGHHDWPFAATAFAAALPWLAGQLDTAGVAHLRLPAATGAPGLSAQAAPTPP